MVFWRSINTSQLLTQLTSEVNSWDATTQTLSYLSKHTDPKLENALKEKLTKDNIAGLTSHLLLNAPTLLDTCLKIVNLDTLKPAAKNIDVLKQAQDEALFLPKPKPVSLSSKLVSNVLPSSGIVGKVITYVAALLTWTYSIDLENPPKSYWAAQNQWMFFRSIITDAQWIGTTLLTYFVTVKKTAAVGATLFILIVSLKAVYHHYNYDATPLLNKNYFREMTPTTGHTSLGRLKETVRFIQDICVPPNIQPNIPILVGPPGVGKTQFVEGISLMVANGEIPRLLGKKVFAVNSASLSQHGAWGDGGEYATRLEKLFREMEGKEAFVILFFDEIHNAASSGNVEGSGNILESLKTKLIEKNILCVMATTEDEYDKYIKPNQAIVDRTDLIPLGNLSDEVTKQILQQQFLLDESEVEVTPEAIDEVITAASKLQDKMNPRKSMQLMSKAIGHVWSWIPIKLKEKQEILTSEIKQLKITLKLESQRNPHWENKDTVQELINKQKELENLEKQIKEQNKLHTQFVLLKNLQKTYQNRHFALVHQKELSEKDLLWTKFVVAPTLNKLVAETVQKFKTDFEEAIPEKVTADLVKSLFPEK